MPDFSIPLAGLDRAAAAVNQAAERIAKGSLAQLSSGTDAPPPATAADTVDLSTEVVALLAAKHAFQANVNVVRTDDELTQALLNVLG